MSNINSIHARQILDSRGNPTIEVDVITKRGILGRASVPSGVSVGKYEAVEFRDHNNSFYLGKSVLKAVNKINKIIAPELIGISIFDQILIDKQLIFLDGTKDKSKFGANSLLGISLAVAKAASIELNLPLYKYLGGVNAHILPVPMINIVNGGNHSDSPIAFQEFMIIPVKAKNFSTAIQISVEIFYNLKKILHDKKLSISVGDEGGFSSKFNNIEDVLDTILKAIEISGYKPGEQVFLALDCAASEFYINNQYDYTKFEGEKGAIRSSEEQVYYLEKLIKKYPIISIEDGMDQDDWKGWKLLTEKLGKHIQLVGDDLFVTNVKRIKRGIIEGIANSILIKANQIGTLTETISALTTAQRAGYTTIISHRSGETEDYTIADLAVAFNTGQIKTGSVSRSDRTSKYNQLIRIEELLGERIYYYPQMNAFKFK